MRSEQSHRRFGQLVAVGIWMALSVAAWWCLSRVDSPAFAVPPLTSVDRLTRWASTGDEADILMGALRLGAVALVAQLLGSAVAGFALGLLGPRATQAVDRAAPRWLARVLRSPARFGLAAAAGVALIALPSIARRSETSGERRGESMAAPAHLESGTASSVVMTPMVSDPPTMTPVASDPPTMALIISPPPAIAPILAGPAPSTSAVAQSAPIDTGAPAAIRVEDTWMVRLGDHLWSIAAETLTDESGHAPSDSEIDNYWRILIDLNRARLLDPENPDFIVPGQILELPEVERR